MIGSVNNLNTTLSGGINVAGVDGLGELNSQLDVLNSHLENTSNNFEDFSNSSKEAGSAENDLVNENEELSNSYEKIDTSLVNVAKNIRSILGIQFITNVLKKVWNIVSDISTEYIDMVESENLFAVEMGAVYDEYGNLDEASSTYYKKAIDFQDELNEKLLTNKVEMEEVQAKFYDLYQSSGVNTDTSEFISEQLTKASLDMASLYNTEIDSMANAIASGVTGQIKALRNYANIDLSEGTIQNVLNDLGIDRTVDQLSYAEKEIARYIAIVNQASEAQGDFARTMESPANQLKMLKNQFQELLQVAGSFIVNTFGNLITYATAVIMVIKELLQQLASLFGYELSSSSSSVSSAIEGVDEDLGSAVSSAKELKKQLMGFDEINNITPDTSSSGGSGSSSVTGIDDKLLDALTEWDNKMGSISNKAQEIKDKILDWLGSFEDAESNLNKILEVIKLIGLAIATWTVSNTLAKIFEGLGIINSTQAFQIAFGLTLTVAGIYAEYNGVKRLLSGDVDLFSILEAIGGGASTGLGIASILRSINKGETFTWGQSLVIGFGIAIAIAGFETMYDGVTKVLNGEITGDNALECILKSVLGGVGAGAGLSMSLYQILQKVKKNETVTIGQSLMLGFGIVLAVTGFAMAYNGMQKIINGSAEASDYFMTLAEIAGATSGLAMIIKALMKGTPLSLGKTLALAIGVTISLYSATDAEKTLTDYAQGEISQLETSSNLLKDYVVNILADAGTGWAIGGPIGGIIGAFTGFATTTYGVVQGLNSVDEALETTSQAVQDARDEIDEMKSSYESMIDTLNDTYKATLQDCEVAEQWKNQLAGVVDENGRVIAGQEERADLILNELSEALGIEITREGNIIKINGEAVGSYQEICNAIDKQIKKIKEAAEAEYYSEKYKEAIKARLEAYDSYVEAYSDYTEKYKAYMQSGTDANYQAMVDAKAILEEQAKNLENFSNEEEKSLQELNECLVKQGNELTYSMVENSEVSSKALSGFLDSANEEWTKLYDSLQGTQKAHMLIMSSDVDNFSEEQQKKWKDLADNDSETFQLGLDEIVANNDSTLLALVTNTIGSTPQINDAWQSLADKSAGEYINGISQVSEGTKSEIKNAVTGVNESGEELVTYFSELAKTSTTEYNKQLSELEPKTATLIDKAVSKVKITGKSAGQAWAEVAQTSVTNYDSSIKQIKTKTENVLTQTKNTVSSQKSSFFSNFQSLGSTIQSGLKTGMGDSATIATQYANGLSNTLSSSSIISKVTSSVTSLGSKMLTSLKSILHISSPSKATAEIAEFFVAGFTNEIDREQLNVANQMVDLGKSITDNFSEGLNVADTFAELSQGIEVNTRDFAIDTNDYIDYGSVSGKINANVQIEVSENMIAGIANGVKEALEDVELNANIEAKVDEGVIVEKTSKGFNDYVRRTGSLPFKIPIK